MSIKELICNDKINREIISRKYKMKDLIYNYFKKNKTLEYLEYKIISDLDQLELINYEANTLKEILKQLQKYYKEDCKRCRYKILLNINYLRSATPDIPGHNRRKIAGKRNVKLLLNNLFTRTVFNGCVKAGASVGFVTMTSEAASMACPHR